MSGFDRRMRELEKRLQLAESKPHAAGRWREYMDRLRWAEMRIYARAAMRVIDVVGVETWGRLNAASKAFRIGYFGPSYALIQEMLEDDTPERAAEDDGILLRYLLYIGGVINQKGRAAGVAYAAEIAKTVTDDDITPLLRRLTWIFLNDPEMSYRGSRCSAFLGDDYGEGWSEKDLDATLGFLLGGFPHNTFTAQQLSQYQRRLPSMLRYAPD